MTDREALDVLISSKSTAGRRYHEALERCKIALERQVPAKPYNDKYCPVCDFYVGDLNGDHFIYCPVCGQRVDVPRNNVIEELI